MDPESWRRNPWLLTPDQIKALTMEEYADLRNVLLGRARQELDFQRRTGEFPDKEQLEQLLDEEEGEADRLRLIEELKRQQGQ